MFWDHDGLLVDTETLFYATTRNIFRHFGVDLPVAYWSTHYLSEGLSTQEIAERLGVEPSRCADVVTERNRSYRESLKHSPLTLVRPHRSVLLFASSKRQRWC